MAGDCKSDERARWEEGEVSLSSRRRSTLLLSKAPPSLSKDFSNMNTRYLRLTL